MRAIVLTVLSVGCGLFLFGLPLVADECPIIVNAYDGGHYDNYGHPYDDWTHSYFAGRYSSIEFRNFFAFHLPSITQTVVRAELRLFPYYIDTPDAFETYELHDISTPLTDLTNRTAVARPAIFDDLGNGTVFGSLNVSTNDRWRSTPLVVPLNNAALTSLMAASGNDFAVGGRVSTLSGILGATELIFDLSYGPPDYHSVFLAIYTDPPQPPQVTSISGPANYVAGTNVTLIPEVCGEGPFTYQWYHGATLLVGRTNAQLVLTNIQPADSGYYGVVVSDPNGSSSPGFQVPVTIYPVLFTLQPISFSVPADDPFTLRVEVLSLYPVSYQWYKWPDTQLTGETNAVYSKQHAATADTGLYYVVASNSSGSSTTTVAQVTVTEYAPIISGLDSQTVPVGATVSFKAFASGSPRPTLQWYFNDQPVPGAAGPELTFVNVTTNEAGTYRLVATNRLGSASLAVDLVVKIPGPLDKWRLRNPFPQPNDLHDVVFGNGQFVAIGEFGSIVSSTNGVDWVIRNSKTGQGLWGLTWNGDRFVAVGPSVAVVSTNGIDWQPGFLGSFRIRAVTYGLGKFVGVGDFANDVTYGPGYALVSSDGFSWQPVGLGYMDNLNDIVFTNGLFVAGGSGGTIFTSTDAVSWRRQTLLFFGNIEAVNFVNGAFWAVGSGGVIGTSTDGSNWVQRTSPVTRRLHDIAYGNGVHVTVGVRGTIVRSTDGVNWTEVNSGTPDRLEGVTFANGLFVAAGESGTTLISSNGLNWIEESAGFRRDWDGMSEGNNLVMAVGKSGMVLTTSNGTDLVIRNVGTGNDLHGVTFGGGKYVAVGDFGRIVISTNAVNWQVLPPVSTLNFKTVAYGNGLYVTVGSGGSIFTSTDAITWYAQSSGTPYDINSIAFGAGKFIAVSDDYYQGNNGRTLSSTDGTNWLSQRLYSGKFPRAITYGDNRFAIAGNDGYLAFSTNGTNWEVPWTGIYRDGDNLRDVAFSHGLWMVVGNSGIILSSSDRVNWKRRYSPVIVNLHGVRYLNGKFLTIGNAGVLLQSELIHSQLSGALGSGGFELTFHPGVGDTFRIQTSSNLTNWSDFTTLNSPADPTVIVDPLGGGNTAKFYRAISP